MSQIPLASSEKTRAALIASGLHLFSQLGYAGASTRAIAGRAETNVASIAYHFGSKEGLRTACAEEVARLIGEAVGQAGPQPVGPSQARAAIRSTLTRLAGFVLGGMAPPDAIGFMLRELAEEGPSVDLVYARMIEPSHRRLCVLWAVATGLAEESEQVRLAVFALMGQLFYFRIAEGIVRRRMRWQAYGPGEMAKIIDTLTRGIESALAGG